MNISVSPEIFEKNSSKTVVVGMSGGVDSSVTALVLKQQGYKVIGLFMKNWEEEDENGVCNASKEYADVVKVCEKLDIPYYSVEFVKEYRDNVFENFLEEYKKGHTPNPDILCNKEIKFKVFFDKAINELKADYLATGHYCQTEQVGAEYKLIKGLDSNKDQSYFLYTIKASILKKVLFPIGHLEKSKVRDLAKEFDLATKDKKDSTGICFIGERNFKNFLSQYIEYSPGKFKTLDGKTVGEHSGSAFYTLGQRKGLGLGGEGPRWFVVEKDHTNNIVYVERGDDHPALYSDELFASEISWVSDKENFQIPFKCEAKVRYRQKNQKCTIVSIEPNKIHVTFEAPQRAVTIGQSVVFYIKKNNKEICLGGAIINKLGENYFRSNRPLSFP